MRRARRVDANQAEIVAALRPRKYRNVPTVLDGRRFDSKAEARRYSELKMLEQAGKITNLRLQTAYPLSAGNPYQGFKLMGHYRADFTYTLLPDLEQRVVEDVKGKDTALSRWKRKHVEAQYGITVQLIRYRGRS